jgi:hypothetical protein
MSQKCPNNLVLLNTLYYRISNQNGDFLANSTNFITTPSTDSQSYIWRLTDKNYTPIDNGFIQACSIQIPPNNNLSGINKNTVQESFMLKTKSGFLSANTFYFDTRDSNVTNIDSVDYYVTAASGEFKNATLIRIRFDNDGTIFSNGVKFARKICVFGNK